MSRDIPVEQYEAGEDAEEARRHRSSKQCVLAPQLRDAIAWLESTVVPTQAQWDMHERTLRKILRLLEEGADETIAPLAVDTCPRCHLVMPGGAALHTDFCTALKTGCFVSQDRFENDNGSES